MESFDFIESGVLLGLNNSQALNKFKYQSKDFAKHGDIYRFLVSYYDTYDVCPTPEVLFENFPTLDTSAKELPFDYALDTFKNQVLFRNIVKTFQENKELLNENPKQAYSKIVSGLNDVGMVYDEDVTSYDAGELFRLEEWRKKNKKRDTGMMGVTTSFNAINRTGVGWQPGELISLYARPTMGKTWLCVHSAATAIMNGFRTLLISTEMPTAAISLRTDIILANMMGYKFSHKALRNGESIDEAKYEEFLTNLNSKNLLICDHIEGQQGMSVESIAGLIRKHHPEFVVLDGVYLVSSGYNSKAAMWEQSHSLFYGLKNLCMAQNIAMLVSTQANREASDTFTPPRPEHVAFGDALLRASDVALSMCKMESDDYKRVVQYQKYRDGDLSFNTSVLDWNVDAGYISEATVDALGEF